MLNKMKLEKLNVKYRNVEKCKLYFYLASSIENYTEPGSQKIESYPKVHGTVVCDRHKTLRSENMHCIYLFVCLF